MKTMTLPNRKSVTLGEYVRSWKRLKTLPSGARISNFGHFPEKAETILREIHFGIHDRINKNLSHYGQGRKWDGNWQAEAERTARAVNTPRLIVRYVMPDLLSKLKHRIFEQ